MFKEVVTIFEEYQSAAVAILDARTGFVIYGSAEHQLMYPASTTKVMTALLVLEHVENLHEPMIISEEAVLALPSYASRMHLAPGDVMTVYEALYGLMLPSGNEVANALAERVAGNVNNFVALMNHRAQQLGATNTRFVNACGLPGDGQHTTAFDMSLIMREAISHPIFNRIISTPFFYVAPTDGLPEGRNLRNTNRMIHFDEPSFNPWVIGGKTGFTNAAQHTLVSYAQRGEHEVIVTVLYAPRLATFSDTNILLDYVFSLPMVSVFEAADHIYQIPVIENINGEPVTTGTITAIGNQNLRIPFLGDIPLRSEAYIPSYLSPPILIGDVVGHKAFYSNDIFVGEVELISTNSILHQLALVGQQRDNSVSGTLSFDAFTQSLSFFPFLAMMPIATVTIFGVFLVMIRRYRRMLRQRKRRAGYVRAEYNKYYQ
ncbi:MAG: D-alanyl-D-alanine carboxypeptidase [Defluviitaleaceae bacterium]|nr:D-alanyl-D-alanine carboxypeptidase [Defluviitaleaceae bacterium]